MSRAHEVRSLPLPARNPDNVSGDEALIVVQLWWSFRFACAGLETSEDVASSIGRRTLGTLVPPPRVCTMVSPGSVFHWNGQTRCSSTAQIDHPAH